MVLVLAAVLGLVLLVLGVRVALRPQPDPQLDGNDLARFDALVPADARGAVNRNSWMLGGGGQAG